MAEVLVNQFQHALLVSNKTDFYATPIAKMTSTVWDLSVGNTAQMDSQTLVLIA